MFYTVYSIRNTLNQKEYIGAHKTENLADGYMGSGYLLKKAFIKYKIENFTKTILHVYDTSELMFEKERELVNETFVARKDTYNIKIGGPGGFDFINSKGLNPNFNLSKFIKSIWGVDIVLTEHLKKNLKKGNAAFVEKYKNDKEFTKKMDDYRAIAQAASISPEAIAKKKETYKRIGHQQKEKHSQFGSCWIHNNVKNMKIKKTELDDFIQLGWIAGRKMSL